MVNEATGYVTFTRVYTCKFELNEFSELNI